MSTRRERSARTGFTLIETMIAVTLLLAIFTVAVPFFRIQARTVGAQAGRMDAQQNVRYAASTVERELRVAGVGVVEKQPMIVQADAYALTFNTDLVTRDSLDPQAVYFDSDVDSSTTVVLPHTTPVTLPRSARSYPESTYFAAAGLRSKAETISFWVEVDVGST